MSALSECQGCRKKDSTKMVTVGNQVVYLFCDDCAAIMTRRHEKLVALCKTECGERHIFGRFHREN